MTLREALQKGSAQLLHGTVRTLNPRLDAETLLLHSLGRPGDRAYLLTHQDLELPPDAQQHFELSLAQRASGKPVQYITGTQEFWGLEFHVSPAVLIPRPETEHLVQEALRIVRQHSWRAPRILDVGTGSGCIAIALAHELPYAAITAVDLSPDALAVARTNAASLGANVSFLPGDLLDPVHNRQFEIIVSNPPYIATSEADAVQPQVRDHEPSTALWAGSDGLTIYRRLIPQARRHLTNDGSLLLEIGWGMEPRIRPLFDPSLWSPLTVINDLQDIPRVLIAGSRE
ncbi:MAG: peptide chain release factor N(5)-glutamine methyltransferase [Acidobacteriales bacterium]|nr:peptide chain release factor N(5)-glutamine methyltransferase [Terriglobales bacterium]